VKDEPGGNERALLWNGTPESAVDLHPLDPSIGWTTGYGIWGNSQVGAGLKFGATPADNDFHAFLWHGSAETAVDLHPEHFLDSYAIGVAGNWQAGYGRVKSGSFKHALRWNGTPDSAVNLHTYLAGLSISFTESQALAVNENGDVVGGASDAVGHTYAILWQRVPEPGSLVLLLGTAALVFCAGNRETSRRSFSR
jgi:uncharacterized membrane protein